MDTSPLPVTGVNFAWVFIKMILLLIVVLGGGLAAMKYLLPRMSWYKRQKSGLIRVLDVFRLEPRKSLYVVKVDEKNLLLGTSEHGISLLGDVSDDYEEKRHSQE